VRTLRNAVERGKVHHAYLFVGSRGTGKTSMAKILAACLNCERGPTVEPCGECESCVSIARASSLDVIEMDAASNNSVDDIRELRESVAYAPVSGRRKVYILDEAHMLSTAAWNAFLKTLEEPPPNTVFVLATTEAGKVPATVVDRCHRFDFQRPAVEQLASVVRRAAQAEGIEIPPAAVAAIARAATGSFRDALGTLEQLMTYSGARIELADVLAVLGVADAALLEETLDAVAGGDGRRTLVAVERSAGQGRDAASFAADLELRARELLVVQTLGEVPAELSLTAEADAALLAQAQRIEHAVVVRLLELLGEALEAVRAGADARTRLELALVKAARPALDGSLAALLSRIERLEQGGSAAARPDRPAAVTAGEPALRPLGEAALAEAAPAEPEGGLPVAAASDAGAGAPEPGAGAPQAADAPQAAVPEPRAGAPEPGASSPEAAAAPAGAPPQPAPAAVEQPSPEPTAAVDDLDGVRLVWPAVVELVRGEHAMLGALIAEAQPVAAKDEDLTLAFAATAQFLKRKAEDPANRSAVGEALRSVTGRRWRLSYELREELDRAGRPEISSEEEWVRRFMEEFDAEDITDESAERHDDTAVAGRERGS